MSSPHRPAFVLNVVPHSSCLDSTLHRLLTIYFRARQDEYSARGRLHFQTVFLPIRWIRSSNEHFQKYFFSENNQFVWGSCKPQNFVDRTLRQLGRCDCSSGYWLNALHLTCLSLFPRMFSQKFIEYWLNQ